MTMKITTIIIICIILVKSTEAHLTGFIVGGLDSRIEDFPHAVFLHIQPNSICGASVLNQAFVLTAAHCLKICNKGFCTITAYTGSKRKYKGSVSRVDGLRIHDKYNERTKANDIALLRLSKHLKLGHKVKRIMIMENPPKYKIAEVSGWGRVNYSEGSSSIVLKHTKQKIIDRDTCQKALLKKIPVGTICGRFHGHPHKGDSGGALVANNRTIQIGIVSFHYTSSINTEVYTDVSYFFNWIKATARRLYCFKAMSKQNEKKKK